MSNTRPPSNLRHRVLWPVILAWLLFLFALWPAFYYYSIPSIGLGGVGLMLFTPLAIAIAETVFFVDGGHPLMLAVFWLIVDVVLFLFLLVGFGMYGLS